MKNAGQFHLALVHEEQKAVLSWQRLVSFNIANDLLLFPVVSSSGMKILF